MNREEIQKMCEEQELELVLADGLDEAFIGYTDDYPARAIYDKALCVQCMMDELQEKFNKETSKTWLDRLIGF